MVKVGYGEAWYGRTGFGEAWWGMVRPGEAGYGAELPFKQVLVWCGRVRLSQVRQGEVW